MEKEKIIKVYESIKSDDVKLFTSLMLSKSDLNLCFGRFPILSLCYLFKAEKILLMYERFLAPINKFEIVPEYFEIYKAFKKYAKKSLRLFVNSNEIVYPILMLGVLDERNLIATKYKFLFKNEEILIKLRKIYNLNQKIEINANSSKFECEAPKIKLKNKIIAGFSAFVFVLMSVFSFGSMSILNGLFGKGTKSSPIYISTEEEFVMALEKGDKYYVLKNDLILSQSISITNFSGTLDGDGYFVKIFDDQESALISNLTGTFQNINIEAIVSDISFSKNFAILTETNKGSILNSNFYIDMKGKYNATEDIYVSGIAVSNEGLIENSKVCLNANVLNEGSTNTFLSAFAGVNKGTILNCIAEDSKIESDTVDLSGVVSENRGVIDGCVNKAQLFQTSQKEWNPNCAGVSMMNYGTILNSKNIAKISSESTLETAPKQGTIGVIVGGIVCDNFNIIKDCKHTGELSGVGKIAMVVVGGVVATNSIDETNGSVSFCKSSTGKLIAKSSSEVVYVGGVIAQNLSVVSNCGFEGVISAHSESTEISRINVYAGGVVGLNNSSYAANKLEKCYSDVVFENPTQNEKVGENEERVNNVYGSIAGCIGFARFDIWGYTSYMFSGSKIYFVSNDSANSIGYWLIYDFTGALMRVQRAAANETTFISCDSIDDIPSEVRIYG